jgi:hypothetical protein
MGLLYDYIVVIFELERFIVVVFIFESMSMLKNSV